MIWVTRRDIKCEVNDELVAEAMFCSLIVALVLVDNTDLTCNLPAIWLVIYQPGCLKLD